MGERFLKALEDAEITSRKTYATLYSLFCELSGWQFASAFVALLGALIVYIGTVLRIVLVFTFLGFAVPIVTAVVQLISETRKTGIPELGQLTAEVLAEFMGVDITAEDIPDGSGKNGNLKQVQAIGGKLHEVLTHEFAPDGVVTPESGEKAARAFTGFNVRWATSNVFVSMLSEMLSDGRLEQVRELGEDVATNLGLGRLHRQALMPLVRNTIAEPYDQLLKKRYRPDRLTDVQYVHAFHRGELSETELHDHLATKGFKDADITRLIREITGRLTEAELARLVRYGDITAEQAVAELNATGIPKDTAVRRFHATDEGRADSIVSTYVNTIEKHYIESDITLEEFNALLDKAPLSELEKQWERNYVGQVKEHPRKRLTMAQARKSFMDGIADLDYWSRFLDAEGYSEEDQLILTYQLLLDAKKAADAAKVKEKIKAKKKVKPSGGTAPLSEATIARLDAVTLPAQLSAPGDGETLASA